MPMEIKRATCDRSPMSLLYGAEGRGKTTLATKFPKPVAMLLERGLPRGVEVDEIGGLANFNAVMVALRDLNETPTGHETLIIDTVDALEPMLQAAVCAKHNWKSIEQ